MADIVEITVEPNVTIVNVIKDSNDLSYTASPTNGTIVSAGGTDAIIPLANSTNAGLLKPSDVVKLNNTSGVNTGDQDLSGKVDKVLNKSLVFDSEISKLANLDNTTDLQKPLSTATINALTLKLATGGYTGTAEDLRLLIVNSTTGITGTSVVPSSTPTGTGIASWIALEAGTYTNFGGVVVNINSIAVISRSASNVYSITQTALVLTGYLQNTQVVDNLTTSTTNLPLSANQGKVLKEIKANLVVGKNLFNYQDADVVLNSVIGGDGNIYGGNSGLIVTGFIPVIPAQVIVSNRSSGGYGNSYYDANKVRLSTTTSTSALTIPAGAFYLRKTVFLSGLGLEAAQIQIELGSVSSPFEAYKQSVPASELGNAVLKTELQPAIDANNLLFLNKSQNLFDETKITLIDTFLGSGGATGSLSGTSISDYIPIVNLQNVFLSGYETSGYVYLCFYDTNKAFISSVSQSTIAAGITGVSSSAFFRFNFFNRFLGQDYIQVEYGTARTAYKPFGWNVKESFIKTSYGENLLNKDVVYAGSINESTGFLSVLGNDRTSRMIKIKTGAKLYSNTDFNIKIVEFDVNHNFLRGSQAVYKNSPKVLGANTEFIKIASDNSVNTTLLVRNSEAPIDLNYYVPFTETLEQPVRPLPTTQDICLPKKIWGISGQQIDIFHVPMKRRYIFDNTYLQFDALSNYEDKSFKTLSSSSAVNASFYDADFLKKKQIATTLVPSNAATDNGNVKVHAIGDSITYINNQYKYVNTNCPNLTFLGTLYYVANSPLAHDGRPGWTLDNYFTLIKSPIYYPAFSPFMHPTDLTLNYIGCTKFWISAYNNGVYDRDMKAKGDAMGGFNTTTGVKITPVTNDVMYFFTDSVYKKWDGSAWVTVTPTFTFNYAKFLSVWSIVTPNIVPIMLGTNDFSRVSDITALNTFNTAWKAQLDTVITSIQAVSATIKVAVVIPPYRGTKKSLYGNWNAPINASMYEQRKLIISSYDDREAEKIYVIDCGTVVDAENDYDVDGNGFVIDTVHPSLNGFNNMGKRIAAFIQGNR